MPPHWLFKMSKWARHPPSMRQVIFVSCILGVCLLVAAIEMLYGWPDALTVERGTFRGWRPE